MVKKIEGKIHGDADLKDCEILIGSSHTHSGGGAFLNIPHIGERLAGPYQKEIVDLYIEQTCEAIRTAFRNRVPAQVGIGYGQTEPLSQYRALWPQNITPLNHLTVLKVTHLDGTPLAVWFNFPVHPTVLRGENRAFSADFVGYARIFLETKLGAEPLYFNGAQGDINPLILDETDRFHACELLGHALALAVEKVWEETATSEKLDFTLVKETYSFKPEATPFGLVLPVARYETEMNLLVLNQTHAFISIPGELSCLYDQKLKEIGTELGYQAVSILGLTNDAHGYIITRDAWEHKTMESGLSFGGKGYGELTLKRAANLLQKAAYH
jgi:hypothetical protein